MINCYFLKNLLQVALMIFVIIILLLIFPQTFNSNLYSEECIPCKTKAANEATRRLNQAALDRLNSDYYKIKEHMSEKELDSTQEIVHQKINSNEEREIIDSLKSSCLGTKSVKNTQVKCRLAKNSYLSYLKKNGIPCNKLKIKDYKKLSDTWSSEVVISGCNLSTDVRFDNSLSASCSPNGVTTSKGQLQFKFTYDCNYRRASNCSAAKYKKGGCYVSVRRNIVLDDDSIFFGDGIEGTPNSNMIGIKASWRKRDLSRGYVDDNGNLKIESNDGNFIEIDSKTCLPVNSNFLKKSSFDKDCREVNEGRKQYPIIDFDGTTAPLGIKKIYN